jgi:hypothetical protein
MITVIIAGLVFLALLAIAVGIADARQAPEWRRIAAERRRRWEARQQRPYGFDGYFDDSGWRDD